MSRTVSSSCEIRPWAGRFMRSLWALCVSVCVWLNGGRIAASPLNATTLFPYPGWVHWSALPWAGNGWPTASLRSPCQNPSHLLWDIWGQCFPDFFCSSCLLFTIIKELKRLPIISGVEAMLALNLSLCICCIQDGGISEGGSEGTCSGWRGCGDPVAFPGQLYT